MQNLATVATQVGVLFALMGAGALCRRLKLIDEAAVKGIVNLLILVVTPCLIVDSFQRPFDSSMMNGFLWAILVTFVAHAAFIAAVGLYRGRDAKSRPVLRLAMVFSNAGFMGIPLEQAILGQEGVFYGIVYVVMFNIFIWSWGLWEMRKGESGAGGGRKTPKEKWMAARSMVLNPGTMGVAAGLPLFLCSAALPHVVGTPVRLMSGLNTPLAMVVIGFYLAGADFRRVVRAPSAYVAVAVRLLAFPLAMIGGLCVFKSHFPREMMLALVIAASAPVAAMVSMFSSKFGKDVDLSVGLVSGSTLLSILTMPPVIAFAMEVL